MNPYYCNLNDIHKNLPNGFHEVCIEISGVCNAKCKYCPSGNVNAHDRRGMMNPDIYKQVVERLVNYKIIGCESQIDLFWWGEPVLNPQIDEIIEITQKYSIPYVISTNANHYHYFQPKSLMGIKRFIISIPGFSQRSYDKIHEFDFEHIKENIIRYVQDFETVGKRDAIWVAYHIYQFNITEMFNCYEFCRTLGISFNPGFAFPLLVDERIAYSKGTLSDQRKEKMLREIVTDQLDRMIAISDKKTCVYQYRNFIVDEKGAVYGCLNIPHNSENYCGNILTDNIDSIIGNISNNIRCSECLESGVSPTDFSFKFFYDDFFDFMKIRDYYENNSDTGLKGKCEIMIMLRRLEISSQREKEWNICLEMIKQKNISDDEIISIISEYCMRPKLLIKEYKDLREKND